MQQLRIRQIALVARELEPAIQSLRDRLAIDICRRDPGVGYFGLHNAVMPVGTSFLEVVSPIREGTSAGRLLDRRGDGGYMVMLQTDSLERERARFARLGVREVFSVVEEDISEVHLHPKDVGGAILSFSEATPPESWRWAGPDWQQQVRTDVVTGICAAELQGRTRRRWRSAGRACSIARRDHSRTTPSRSRSMRAPACASSRPPTGGEAGSVAST